MSVETVRTDAITTEIFANLFRAVVDEMAWIVLRSSHTTFVKETQDFSTGLVTPEGEMFSTPTSAGAGSNACTSMAAGTRAFADWRPGDVLITNDPYSTSGMVMHLNDIYLFKPVFHEDRLLCFAWAFIHCTDVGGYAPGSIDMQNHEVFQEGLRLRPVKLYEEGRLEQRVWNFLADNSRIPALNWGDISALVAALDTAERRLHRLCQRYGAETVRRSMYDTLDRTEQLARAALRTVPAGSYRFVEYFEDDYISDVPVRLQLCLTSDGEGKVVLDFAGSDPQVRAALNLPTGGQRHHPFLSLGVINFIVSHTPELHFNAGVVRPVELELPESSVVNAAFPAACGMRYSTAVRVHDLILGALQQAVPGRVPAGGSGQVVITYISTSELGANGRVVVANPVQGGSGGALGLDGISGINYGSAFLRNVPVEVLESEAPVVVHRFGLRPDTEGAGRWRGGYGIEYALEVRHPRAVVVMRGKDRHRFSAWGAAGGHAGTTASNIGRRPGEAPVDVGKTTVYRARQGETLSIRVGGGGGYGSPLRRDPALVESDWRDGLLSPERAREVYGVVLGPEGVDDGATMALRAERAKGPADAPATEMDYGTGRTAWERRFGVAAERLAARLREVPAALRRPLQEQVYAALAASGPGPYGEEEVEGVITGVLAAMAGIGA
jgi:N-methylhydantoinase B